MVAGPSGASGGSQRTPAAGALQSGRDGFGDEDGDPAVAPDGYRGEAWCQVVGYDWTADHAAGSCPQPDSFPDAIGMALTVDDGDRLASVAASQEDGLPGRAAGPSRGQQAG
jgi:hypothetical protein